MITARNLTYSIAYSLGQIILGFLLHPFQTMQILVRDKYWLWMVLTPSVILLLGFILWQSTWTIIFYFFAPTPEFLLPLFGLLLLLIKHWFFYFCLLWQILLLLLLIKFWRFFRHQLRS
jgi:hypothetical protein